MDLIETAHPHGMTRPSTESWLSGEHVGAFVAPTNAYFAHKGEIVMRPSPSAPYFLPNLEADLEAPDLITTQGSTWMSKPISFRLEPECIVIRVSASNDITEDVLRDLRKSQGAGLFQLLRTRLCDGVQVKQPAALTSLPSDASVEAISTRLSALVGLSDGEMSKLFPGEVQRETYQRWRTGRMRNPTPANRRRMGVLLRLFQDLSGRDLDLHEWIRNPSSVEHLTPYELLVQGRLDEVEALAAQAVPAQAGTDHTDARGHLVATEENMASFVPRHLEGDEDLEFEDEGDLIEIEGDVELLDD